MGLTPYQLPPGVVATPTKTSRSTNWRDANLIRWSGAKLEPVGGWEKIGYDAVDSKLRAIHTWTTLAGLQMTAYLCEGHCYVDKGDGVLVDISPTVAIVQPGSMAAGGYGDNVYNFGDYGTPRPDRTDIGPVTPGYYLDNWGQNLLAMTGSDGRLLQWDPDAVGGILTPVTGAPTSNRAFVVTPQRHVMLFGAGGVFNRQAWCSQEDISDWNYASLTNTAGFYDIEPASPIIAASKAGDEVIYFTAAGDVFVSQYIGVPYVYSYDKVGNGVTPISPMSIEDTPIGAVWATFNGFWKYDAGSVMPVACNVWTWITDRAEGLYSRYNAFMFSNTTFSELWWFFPDKNGDTDNAFYVQWNYKEGWWSTGRLKRTCGASSTYQTSPLMSDGVSVFRHESGWFYDEDNYPWAETFSINVQGGGLLSTFWQIFPDYEGPIGAIAFSLDYNIPRADASRGRVMSSDLKTIDPVLGVVGFRDTGRDFRMKVQQVVNGSGKWSTGEHQFDIRPRGMK